MKLIPETEACERLNLPPSVLRALRRKGQGPRHVVLLRKAHYDPEDLDAWVLSQMSEPATSTAATTPASEPKSTEASHG